MTKNYIPASLVMLEKDNIHFNTLMSEAHTVIDNLSGALWTDTDIHDPGITLLESLAWNISDLSYRCLLPVQDLLTPVDAEAEGSLFPPGFMPEQMLTTSPITIDDYRRGILDLTPEANPTQGYYFSDARVSKQEGEDRYKTYYDAANRQFVFNKEEEGSNYTLLYLNGAYEVQARRAFLPVVMSDPPVDAVLEDYLAQNRNLCEVFRKVEVINAETVLPLTITIEVNDTLLNINDFYAELYIVLHQSLALPVQREAEIDLASGSYTGPRAEYGWIPTLPASDFGTGQQRVSVGQFILSISLMSEVQAVRKISLDPTKLVLFQQEAVNKQFILWTMNGGLAERINKMLELVSLYRQEVRLTANKDEILNKLSQRLILTPSTPSEPLPVGRYRNLRRYYPASSLVPPLYNLQAWSPDSQTQQLHRFMLGFEQLLASHADGLERLCRLLNFSVNDTTDKPVYGSQWPFAENTPYDDVHQEIKADLIVQDASGQGSQAAELKLTRFLLAYFGVEPVDIPAENDAKLDEYLKISHALLKYMPQVGYARTAIHIGNVSSLQRRLAGQLGYGPKLFVPEPNMADLPFYLVEHPLLLPARPEGALPGSGKVQSARMVTVGDKELLLIELTGPLAGILTAQHMVNLVLPTTAVKKTAVNRATDGPDTQIKNLLVVLMGADMDELPPLNVETAATEVKANCFFLYPQQFRLLRLRLAEVLAAAKATTLVVEFSNVWLNEMSYMLEEALAEPVSIKGEDKEFVGASWKIRTSDDQPWPAILRKDNILILQPVYGSVAASKEVEGNEVAMAPEEGLKAKVLSVDDVAGQAIIQLETLDEDLNLGIMRYSWYIEPASNELLLRDRFSFTLSLVFRRSLITQGKAGDLDNPDGYDSEQQRIRRIVQAEVPAHIQTRLLWLSDEQFTVFAGTYDSWQKDRLVVGEHTLKLLRMLSIGMLNELLEGIGEMILPSEDVEKLLDAVLAKAGVIGDYEGWSDEHKKEWQAIIAEYGLLFIPPEQG